MTVPRPDAQAEHSISYPSSAQKKWPSTIVCRAALAVLLARYTDASEALFGFVAERPLLVEGQETPVDGPTRCIVPTRVLCTPRQSGSDIMREIAAHDTAVREFEQTGLRGIRGSGDCGSAACGFQTVLVVTAGDSPQAPRSRLHRAVAGPDKFAPYTDRALLLDCQMAEGSALLLARYDASVIDARQVARFLRQFGSLIEQFQGRAVDLPVRELEIVTQEDQAEIRGWNSGQIRTSEVCIHDVIAKRASSTLDEPAIFAWDGEWTYAELDSLSSQLAGHIQSLDLDSRQAIPLCFEKSKWMVVAMLAVLKAGRPFTLIDPSNPPARISTICQQASATVALTSKLHRDTMSAAVPHCTVVDDDLLLSLPRVGGEFTSLARPQDVAYIIFTSGSTGEPKGIMIEHRGFVPCSLEFGPALSINNNTRALQFASYAFGACLVETLTTLMHGGCVCIPSEDDRMNDIPGFINRARVNWALFTPSFIGAIQPESVCGLQTLVLGGEAISAEMRDTWAPRVELLYAYGQSETSTVCSVAKVHPGSAELNAIGRAAGARFWITDPNDIDRLAPVGCIGELVIESPGVARGYLVAPPQDRSPFLAAAPAWYLAGQVLDGVSFYRTGDLVRYRSDGIVAYLGRRDSQVKIRGQRVELSDVETHLREQLDSHIVPVVEAVRASDFNNTILVAFLTGPFRDGEDTPRGTSGTEGYLLDGGAARGIRLRLQEVVPQHSIPAYYIRLESLPKTTTGKIDRRILRSTSTRLLDETNRSVTSRPEEMPPSSTTLKGSLRQLWFRCLNLDPNSESHGANFFDLGGDSITAIKMVNMARSTGMALSIDDVFKNPTLIDLVDVIRRGSTPHGPTPSPAWFGPVEQSFAQRRLWFLDQLSHSASWYLNPIAVRMRG
ncbi:amino acid adenylation domain-containing protein, partial [Candidatus Bathyarchaeota archaeon]|nr:amino acid adenylation domain-containing protein [Candidatus Bathyarchaeota archaeon]